MHKSLVIQILLVFQEKPPGRKDTLKKNADLNIHDYSNTASIYVQNFSLN